MQKIYYGKAVYNTKEIRAVINVLKNNSLNLVDGPHVKILEKKVAKIFGKKFGLMVNSGSSANLLSLASFNFRKGSEIITPTLTFSTTVSPIYQVGCVPHFVDVEKNHFGVHPKKLENYLKNNTLKRNQLCINKKTQRVIRAIIIVHVFGHSAEIKGLIKIAKKYNIKIIEDAAEALGSFNNKKHLKQC